MMMMAMASRSSDALQYMESGIPKTGDSAPRQIAFPGLTIDLQFKRTGLYIQNGFGAFCMLRGQAALRHISGILSFP
jgi:hypothetical protein